MPPRTRLSTALFSAGPWDGLRKPVEIPITLAPGEVHEFPGRYRDERGKLSVRGMRYRLTREYREGAEVWEWAGTG